MRKRVAITRKSFETTTKMVGNTRASVARTGKNVENITGRDIRIREMLKIK